jgi:hypothetical protein
VIERECAKCGRLVGENEDGVYLDLFEQKEEELEAVAPPFLGILCTAVPTAGRKADARSHPKARHKLDGHV